MLNGVENTFSPTHVTCRICDCYRKYLYNDNINNEH